MTQKITWQAPTDLNITNVEINKSTEIYGTYSVLALINATSDGLAKSGTNTWVTTYTDSTGTKDNWYKIRFYDSNATTYSDYSDPITSVELLRLCTVDQVKATIDTVGRWTDDEIFDAITFIDDMIYIEAGTPLQATLTYGGQDETGTPYRRFYVGEKPIYRIDRLFYGTANGYMQEAYLDDDFKTNLSAGMIEILPYASSGIDFKSTNDVEIEYVPKIYNDLSLFRTCEYLLKQIQTEGKQAAIDCSKEKGRITQCLNRIEQLLANRVGVQITSQVEYYNSVYGVNRKIVNQDFDRNEYMGNRGW